MGWGDFQPTKKHYLNQSISHFFQFISFFHGKKIALITPGRWIISWCWWDFSCSLIVYTSVVAYTLLCKYRRTWISSYFLAFHFHINSQFIVAKWFFFGFFVVSGWLGKSHKFYAHNLKFMRFSTQKCFAISSSSLGFFFIVCTVLYNTTNFHGIFISTRLTCLETELSDLRFKAITKYLCQTQAADEIW